MRSVKAVAGMSVLTSDAGERFAVSQFEAAASLSLAPALLAGMLLGLFRAEEPVGPFPGTKSASSSCRRPRLKADGAVRGSSVARLGASLAPGCSL